LPSLEEIRAEQVRRTREAEAKRVREDANAIRARCLSFTEFVKEAWHVIEPGTPLKWNWHLTAMCLHLEAITFKRMTPWLIVNVPPGSSKSTIISVLWQAWEWGPCGLRHLRYVSTSFEEGNVKRDTRKCRDLIGSEWFRTLWPNVEMVRTGELSFANSDTGSREGVAFGSVTGKRGDRLVVDDPHSLKGAESETQRNESTRLFLEGGLNRSNDAQTSAIVLVMQRLHEQDLTGVLLARDLGFVHLMIPMEYEPGRAHPTPIGWSDPRAFDGELMDPNRMPREAIDRQKKAGTYAWAGQYQQRPSPREGGLFKRSWFKFVGAVPAGDRKRCRAWDLAATAKAAGNNPDWTAGPRVSMGADRTFLIETVARVQAAAGEAQALVRSIAATDGVATKIRLTQDPGQAGKAQAAAMIRDLAGYNVVVKTATGDKATRATPAAVQAEAGNISILQTGDPALDAWIEPFLAELGGFPAGSHDDQVDGFADAINELALAAEFHWHVGA
jgi:predicted phage terminase large subunit-like protein